jgi:hypothetical protein
MFWLKPEVLCDAVILRQLSDLSLRVTHREGRTEEHMSSIEAFFKGSKKLEVDRKRQRTLDLKFKSK